MIKKLYFSMLLVAGLAMAACSSDDSETTPAIKTYTMTVDATKGTNDAVKHIATRALSLDEHTLNASWATTEQVYVQGTYKGTPTKFWFKGSIKPQYAGTTTRLNGVVSLPDDCAYPSLDDAIDDPHILTLQFPRKGDRVYTGQVGTLADIAANYDYAIASNVRVDVATDKVIGVKEVKFENQQAIVKFTLKYPDGTTLMNPTALTVKYGEETLSLTIPASTYETNGNGVLFVAIPGEDSEDLLEFEGKKVILTATAGSEYTFIKSGVTFENGQYYEINVKMKS